MWLNVCNVNVLYMNMLSRFLKRHGSNDVSNLYSGWREFDFLWFDQWPLVVLGAADILISTSVTVAWPRTLDTQSIHWQVMFLVDGNICADAHCSINSIWCRSDVSGLHLICLWNLQRHSNTDPSLNSMLCKQIGLFVLMPNVIAKSCKSCKGILAICTGNHRVHTDEDICAELYHQW